MSKPENWKQEGPLGDAEWSVEFTDRVHGDIPAVIVHGEVSYVRARDAQHLRDFARAMNRAADALEAAAEPAPVPSAAGAPHRFYDSGELSFMRDGPLILTQGVDIGPRVLVVAERGSRMLWKIPGHYTWGGNYQPRKYLGTSYRTIELVREGCGRVVQEASPGVRSRAIVELMRAWVEAAPTAAPVEPGEACLARRVEDLERRVSVLDDHFAPPPVGLDAPPRRER